MSERSTRWMAGGALLGGALLFSLLTGGGARGEADGPAVARVRTAPVEAGASVPATPFPGRVRAVDHSRLAFAVPGRLVARAVRLGDRVDAGAILAKLEADDLRHGVEAAAARVHEIAADLFRQRAQTERVRALFDRTAATREELEAAEADLERLEAAGAAARVGLEEARRLEGEAVLTAPFAGTVVAVGAETGEWIPPGTPVVELAGDGARELVLEVPASVTAALSSGVPVVVSGAAGASVRVEGHVEAVGAASAGPGSLIPVRVALPPDAPFHPGDTAVAELPEAAAAALRVPLVSIVDPSGDSPAVFRVRGSAVERVPVRVQGWLGEAVEVAGALTAGDRVVVAGQGRLLDGQTVEVLP